MFPNSIPTVGKPEAVIAITAFVDELAEFTIGGETRTYRAGDSYSIPAGVEHGALIKAGTRVIDVFEEADRYPIKD